MAWRRAVNATKDAAIATATPPRVSMATAGVAPRIMGFGPAPATRKVLALTLERRTLPWEHEVKS